MLFKRGRYSGFIRPIIYILDIVLLTIYVYIYIKDLINLKYFLSFFSLGWLITSFFTGYYNVYRFTNIIKILSQAFKQYAILTFIFFSYFGVYDTHNIKAIYGIKFLLLLFFSSLLVKIIVFFALKQFRLSGGNKRNTIIIGHNDATKTLENFFLKKPIYGYKYLGFFTNKNEVNKLGDFDDCFHFLNDNGVDDIYCSISEFKQEEIVKLIKYANTNFKTLKFIPDANQILSSGFEVDYYDYFPVLKLNEIALNNKSNRLLKRGFDILFSLVIIAGVLSWLTPLLFIIIKLESKGPLFFVRKRNGLDYKTFDCYKFRTLRIHDEAKHKHHVNEDDDRVTKVGKFLRKTSIDELPQFFNVLKGEMSVVGPRPHMLEYNKAYANQVNNVSLMARHLILPGITGLAQIRGYRGLVKSNNDIIGRVKFDLFYIKNWSILLDIKIIIMTILNFFKGDEKAF